jgi:hypothetical protein
MVVTGRRSTRLPWSAFLSKLKRENAEDIHETLKTSAASRFGLRWVGLIISWPRHGDDFTMTRHKEAVLNPELGVYADGPASTCEINELTKLEPRVQIREGLEVPASPRRLHPPDRPRAQLRRRQPTVHRPRGVHRLRRLRGGLSGRRDLPRVGVVACQAEGPQLQDHLVVRKASLSVDQE